jgi:hypothetical protein
LIEGEPDDQDARSEALIALVQSELFESIVNITEADDEELTHAERIDLLSSAAKNIATMTRASVHQKRHRLKLEIEAAAREKLVKEQKAKLGELEKSGLVPGDAMARVIDAIHSAYGL